jgi:hypothetical protein
MYRCYGGFITGDTKDDGSEFLPTSTDNLKWDVATQRYLPTTKGIKNIIGTESGLEYEDWSPTDEDKFLKKQSRNVYRDLLKSPYNPNNKEVILFKIDRTQAGRDSIERALYSQIDWVYNFDKDLLENGISPNAKDDLLEDLLWHKGSYAFTVDPNDKVRVYQDG